MAVCSKFGAAGFSDNFEGYRSHAGFVVTRSLENTYLHSSILYIRPTPTPNTLIYGLLRA